MSLLCVDYKIGTKALAARLQKVLSSVLREDQTCGVPARSIFEPESRQRSDRVLQF